MDPSVHSAGGKARAAQKAERWEAEKAAQRKTVAPIDAPAAPETLEDAKQISSWATHAVITGQLGIEVARVVTGLLREFREAAAKVDLEARVRTLEKVMDSGTSRNAR